MSDSIPPKPARRWPTKAEILAHAKGAWQRLRGGEMTPLRAAASVAVGLAIGVMPLWGVHWLAVMLVCLPLRLDAGVAYLAANISIPPIAPFITFAEVELGARVLHGAWISLKPADIKGLDLATVAEETAVGTALVAAGGAVFGFLLTYPLALLRARARASRAPSATP